MEPRPRAGVLRFGVVDDFVAFITLGQIKMFIVFIDVETNDESIFHTFICFFSLRSSYIPA